MHLNKPLILHGSRDRANHNMGTTNGLRNLKKLIDVLIVVCIIIVHHYESHKLVSPLSRVSALCGRPINQTLRHSF